jgi:hypothetical protein
MRSALLLVVATCAVTACGLSLTGTEVTDGSSSSSSGGSTSSTSSSSGGSTSSGGTSVADSATTDSASEAGATDAGSTLDAPSSDPCFGKPDPHIQENGKCYWLSADTTEARQAGKCTSEGGKSFVPVAPSMPAPPYVIPPDYFIPGKLLAAPRVAKANQAWVAAKSPADTVDVQTISLPGGMLSVTVYGWIWPGNVKTYLDERGTNEEGCLQALPTAGGIPQSQAVACGSTTLLPAVCQTP